MTKPPRQNESEPTKSASELAQEARTELTRLHHDVVEAEERVVKTSATELLEANELLVVSTLRAQTDAQTFKTKLKESRRPNEIDELTGLPNRALLLDRFGQAIAHAKRNRTWLALLFVDLDNFKQINDTLGHAVGDQALQLAARCLASSVRAGDTVSRHGGDEFLILLAEISQESDAVLVAEKVIAALAAPSRAGDHVFRLSASIGISVYPNDGEDAETLTNRADAAMYLAKKHGLGRFVFHDRKSCNDPTLQRPAGERRRQT